jgi:hypothetical protein
MTIVLEKTWGCEIAYTSSTTAALTNKKFMVSIKNILKLHGWVVAQSCDSVSVAIGDLNDNWIDEGDITNAAPGSAHSWIVLKNSNISTNFSLCIDFSSAAGASYVGFYCTTAGYQENGTTAAKPTVNVGGYENTLQANTLQWTGTVATEKQVMLLYSSDYKCYRFFLDHVGSSQSQWFIEVPKNPPSWFTNPYMASITTNTLYVDYVASCVTTVTRYKTDVNSAPVTLGFGSVGMTGALGNTIYGYRQDVNGNFLLSPIYLISTTSSYPGIYGELYDMYWTSYLFERSFPYVGGFFKTSTSSKGLIVFSSVAYGNNGNYNGFKI